MNRPLPPDRVPTLTEVVEMPGAAAASVSAPDGPDTSPDDALARRLVGDLQLHIDRVLDARLKAAIEPVLDQLVARVLAETRRELASTLRDGLARALAQELSRHRGEPARR